MTIDITTITTRFSFNPLVFPLPRTARPTGSLSPAELRRVVAEMVG